MSYSSWFDKHAIKHKKIVNKLISTKHSKEQIIEYFEFNNMVKNEPNFCPLYKKSKKCHDMEDLNCYLCACPNFRFNDEGIEIYNGYKILSKCSINNGEKLMHKEIIHQDCSSCSVPHHKSYIEKNFNLKWEEIMQESIL